MIRLLFAMPFWEDDGYSEGTVEQAIAIIDLGQ
jgi:hypothetical protein